jgi:hypothetical protein
LSPHWLCLRNSHWHKEVADVANVWQNRLIGDAHLPEAERRTKTNVILEKGERTRRFRCSSVNTIDQLTPSGLMGPVRLEFGQEKHVKFD